MTKNVHLEHIEDLMLMYGEDGVKESFDYIDGLVSTFSSNPKNSKQYSTKWDGAPAIFVGYDPADKQYFVAKKGIFNTKPILFKSHKEIDEGEKRADLNKVYHAVFTYMKPLFDSGKLTDVVQGDFLFHDGGGQNGRKKVKDVHNENCIIFGPQLIQYCIPDHDELYDAAANCKLCLVIHAKYPIKNVKTVADLSVNFGFDASHLSTKDTLILSPFTSELGKQMVITRGEKTKLVSWKAASKRLLPHCKDFLNTIAPTHKDPWGMAYFIKQFFNAKVREGQKVTSASKFYDEYCKYWETKYRKEIDKKVSPKAKAKWRKQMFDGMAYLAKNKKEFVAMVALYNTIQNIKNIFVPKLESGERFRAYYYDEKTGTYEIGNQEGYVAIRESDKAVKLVQRLGGFSERNFNAIKKWSKK